LAGTDDEVRAALAQFSIGLTIEEARKVASFLHRDPTIVEAVIWGIQGSEHCSYKSSRRFLKQFITEGKHVILGPKEDSGIIAITDGPPGKRWGFVVSHESHNKPSQIVPYEGAATGVGGNVRDVCCMGARVIGAMDALRLGDGESDESKTIAREVVRGIAGYGNPLGIPNLGGDVVFDAAYNKQCLVNVVCFGIVREDEIIHSFVPEEAGRKHYDIIIVGKPTDRSGFGGAAFASLTLDEKKKEKNTGAVQEPNPFLERHILASTYALFDWLAEEKHLSRIGFKDLGAGGVVCSSVEQVADQGLGADIELDRVHTSLPDLPPEVIACAETQERFCFICHPSLTEHILHHYNAVWDLPSIAENARASVIGKVTEEPIYRLKFHGEVVCEAKATDITCGLTYDRPIREVTRKTNEPTITIKNPQSEIPAFFRAMLSHINGGSRSPIFRHYDKNVIGNTIVERGEAHAGVIMPLQNLRSYVHEGAHRSWDDLTEEDKYRGVAVACSGSGRYGKISPYLQGVNATITCLRRLAAVGAKPRAITDCLNYGNPEDQEKLWDFSEGVRGIAEAAKYVSIDHEPVPIISGNVSLYNGDIPPTAIVSAIGVLQDARTAAHSIIQKSDEILFLVGERKDECGGSLFYHTLGELGANVPNPDFEETRKQIAFVLDAMDSALVSHCSDIGEGGLLYALFEMLVPYRRQDSNMGMDLTLINIMNGLSPEKVLFGETGGFILSVNPEHATRLRTGADRHRVTLSEIGRSTRHGRIRIEGLMDEDRAALVSIWQKPLEQTFGI